jgi:hypothetical protein
MLKPVLDNSSICSVHSLELVQLDNFKVSLVISHLLNNFKFGICSVNFQVKRKGKMSFKKLKFNTIVVSKFSVFPTLNFHPIIFNRIEIQCTVIQSFHLNAT